MALIRPSIDFRQFSLSEEGSTYNEKKQKCICVVSAVCALCHGKGCGGEMRRHPCILGDPQTKGDKIRSQNLR